MYFTRVDKCYLDTRIAHEMHQIHETFEDLEPKWLKNRKEAADRTILQLQSDSFQEWDIFSSSSHICTYTIIRSTAASALEC